MEVQSFDDLAEEFLPLQIQPQPLILTTNQQPPDGNPLKRKNTPFQTASSSSGEEMEDDLGSSSDVKEVVRRIKKIKFPLYIHLKTLNGRIIDLDLDYNDRISRVKDIVQEKEGIPSHQQKLIFLGKTLDNQRTIKSCGVYNGSTIYLIIALPHRNGYSGVSSEHRRDAN